MAIQNIDIAKESTLQEAVNVLNAIANAIYTKSIKCADSTTAETRIYSVGLGSFIPKINTISNDGTESLTLMIGSQSFILKGGETLNDIEMGNSVTEIRILADGNNTPFRMMYLENIV